MALHRDPVQDHSWGTAVSQEAYCWHEKDDDLPTVAVANVAFASAEAKAKVFPWTKRMFLLYLCLLVATVNSVINGYDGTLMSSINSYPQYREYFGFDPVNGTPTTGLVYAIYQIGNLVGSFAAGPATDWNGRKWGMFIGACVIVLGTAIQATSATLPAFMGGRFTLGFGVSICATAGPAYASEMAHPAYRGVLTGLFNTFWYVGAIPGTFVPYATSMLDGTPAWRIPTWLQLVFSGIVVLGAPWLPETPRWLIANDRHEEALNVMAKYHGEGSRDSPIVQLEYKEMVEDISITGADKRWWDYRELFNTREVRYRTFTVVTFAFFSQWVGNGPISYYYPTVLQGAGITNNQTRLLLNGFQTLISLSGALIGAAFTDKWGRRKQLLTATFIITLIFVAVTALNATNILTDPDTGLPVTDDSGTPIAISQTRSKGVIAVVFVFGFVYSAGFTPLQALYPVECLRYESRAKGMAMYNFFVNVANFYNTFVTGIAFTHLAWKYYFLFIAWDSLQFLVIYLCYVETKRRTLEELTEIFRSARPVKTSLGTTVVVVREGRGVEVVDDESVGVGKDSRESRWSWE
ncbi:putative mfs lactose protein [Neofusicoccum parvum]|uniref:Major facilitator superfamily (MFS) profile domain-containing protein n=3 Tax=Neofusicoccum TaxID=407951 RepID=A0ABR3T2Q9_9PEZI|nr:putative mfs lactose protein [Neofusicoccum parvum UCRNP2]GME39617.1 putative mfs lactose protein [Neofusicoccum parvum]GME43240.1 putative mfs lactose protein [Neofusicoccum parvum]